MISLYDYIIKPIHKRYENEKVVNGKELILNTQLTDHTYVSRVGIVISVPALIDTEVKVGDIVIVHHNIFRRFYDMYGVEKNSRSYFKEDLYFCKTDQLYLYKRDNGKWMATPEYCFVAPIKQSKRRLLRNEKTEPLIGVLKISNSSLEALGINEGDVVGISPNSEFEFNIDGEMLYRVTTPSVTINYGRREDKERYYRSWEKSNTGAY